MSSMQMRESNFQYSADGMQMVRLLIIEDSSWRENGDDIKSVDIRRLDWPRFSSSEKEKLKSYNVDSLKKGFSLSQRV